MHLHFGDLFVLSNAGFVHALMLVVLRFDVRGLILGMVAQALVYIRSFYFTALKLHAIWYVSTCFGAFFSKFAWASCIRIRVY